MITVLFHGNRYHEAIVCPTCHAILQYEEKDKIRTMPWTYEKFRHNWNKHRSITPYIVCPECQHKILFKNEPQQPPQNQEDDSHG